MVFEKAPFVLFRNCLLAEMLAHTCPCEEAHPNIRGWFSRLEKESTYTLELLAAGLTRGNPRDLCWSESVTAVFALWGYWGKGNTPVWP